MPDTWEYPWFAAWDLAFHCGALALVDVDFAKSQIELMLRESYLHANGQIPAYEWNFSDVNPPVHAMGALKVFRAERVQRGRGDLHFLHWVFHKLLLNYAWWINRKDADGHNVFEGGFLGLDNISVFDRSHPLPGGYSLKQADATGWMAMFALNMTVMALELATADPDFEDIAVQAYEQFLSIADAIGGHTDGGVSLWDPDSGFFKDIIVAPDGSHHRIDVYSMVGLIPLFATEIVDERLLARVPRFRSKLIEHGGGLFRGNAVCACPDGVNERGEHLLALVDHTMLTPILTRLLDEAQFLSAFGVRSVSRIHQDRRDLGVLPGVGQAVIEYVPGESNSPMFGGNSNWRGPIWLPVNYALIQAIEKYHRFLGDGFRVPVPCLGDEELTLNGIATLIAERIVDLYRRGPDGSPPALNGRYPFVGDDHWKDLLQFYEYFHAETGQGLGAAHQTGWTGLIANLVMRRYRKDIPAYWTRRSNPARRRPEGMSDHASAAPVARPAVLIVYAVALAQGTVLVSFPALSAVLKQDLGFTDAQYGAIFLPQLTFAVIGAIGGGVLARRLGLKALLIGSLVASAISQGLLAASGWLPPDARVAGVMTGTGALGLAFGLIGAPINAYPALLFPNQKHGSVVAAHALIGLGLAAGPLLASAFVGAGAWTGLPLFLAVLVLLLAASAAVVTLPEDTGATTADEDGGERPIGSPTFWVFLAIAVLYAFAEGTFANWAVLYLTEVKSLGDSVANYGLSAFWGALVAGRLLISALVAVVAPAIVWTALPVMMVAAFLLVPTIGGPLSGIGLFAFAGLACSAFFPLSVTLASERFPRHVAWVSSMLIAALMVGVGLGSYVIGSLREMLDLSMLYRFSAGYPVAVLILALPVLASVRRRAAPARSGS